MLSQRFKENIDILSHNKNLDHPENSDKSKNPSMLYRAIEILKSEKQSVIKQREEDIKQFQKQKSELRSQVQYYKKRVSELSECTILNSLISTDAYASKKKQESDDHCLKKLQMENDHLKAMVKEKDRSIAQLQKQKKELDQKIRVALKEKEKNMEMSLTEKIVLDERIQLLQKDVTGKKRIIEGLKKQIDNVSELEKDLWRKQKEIVKRGKQMQKFEEQFQGFYSSNEKNYKNKIENLMNQNSFLRKQLKKVLKQVKKSCKCEGEADKWKEKLYKIGRQLAQARVQIGKTNFLNQRTQKQHSKDDSSSSQYELASLELSEDSSIEES